MYKEKDREAELLLRLERNIEVGEKNYFSDRAECFVFRYSFCGKFKAVTVEKGIAAAKLLHKFEKINVAPQLRSDGSVEMFNKSHIASCGANGRLVWIEVSTPFRYQDAHFTQREVLEICTLAEFQQASEQAGGILGKIIRMTTSFINQVA